MSRERAQAAASAGDVEAARKIDEDRAAEIARIRDRAAVKKRKIREQ
jgi:hypothetical protein